VAGLKYAQKLAVASGCDVHVVINDSGYRVRQQAEQDESCDEDDTTWPTDVALADGDVLAGSKPFGIIMSEDVTLTFDALGATDLGADEEVGVGQFEFTIHAASGYIEAP
jgi:MSHA pilin protein MshC